MSYFVEHGRFPAERYEYPRKLRNLITCIAWNVVLSLPLLWYIISVIISGSITSFIIAGTIALIGEFYPNKFKTRILGGNHQERIKGQRRHPPYTPNSSSYF